VRFNATVNNKPHNSMLCPAEMVQRIAVGDSSVESEFVKKYSRPLFLFLLSHTNGDEFASRECTQEALLIALLKMRAGNIRKPAEIAAFLRGTAVNVFINYCRKQKRYVELKEENIIQLRTSVNLTERELNSEQILTFLQEIIGKLSRSRDIEILRKFYLEGQPKEDICNKLDLSKEHFDRVLSRAKKRVRTIISKNKSLEMFLHDEIVEAVDEYE